MGLANGRLRLVEQGLVGPNGPALKNMINLEHIKLTYTVHYRRRAVMKNYFTTTNLLADITGSQKITRFPRKKRS